MVEAIMFAHTKFQMRIYARSHVYCLKLVDIERGKEKMNGGFARFWWPK